jgi:hypothetical protein
MFAIRFVPYGNYFETSLSGEHACFELRLGLVCEAIADPDRILAQDEWIVAHAYSPFP